MSSRRSTTSPDLKPFWAVVRGLRRAIPPKMVGINLPIWVRLKREIRGGHMGICRVTEHRGKEALVIELDRNLVEKNPSMAMLLLAHEWAHALTAEEEEHHSLRWGKMLSIGWRIMTGEITDEEDGASGDAVGDGILCVPSEEPAEVSDGDRR